MRRVGIGLLVALVLGAAAIAATARSSKAGTSGAKAETITIWVGWSARELKEFKKIVTEYDNKHADVNVKVVGGINDDKITAAIRSGNVPDVVSSFTSANVGSYCKSGAWIDLKPFLSKDKIDAISKRTAGGGLEITKLIGTSAWYAPGQAATEMVDAILRDKKKILPCSVYLEGEYGINGLFVGVPVKLGARGIEQIIQIKLTPEEDAALKKSAAAVKELVDVIGM